MSLYSPVFLVSVIALFLESATYKSGPLVTLKFSRTRKYFSPDWMIFAVPVPLWTESTWLNVPWRNTLISSGIDSLTVTVKGARPMKYQYAEPRTASNTKASIIFFIEDEKK